MLIYISIPTFECSYRINGYELWCLMPLSTIFQLIYCGDQFYW
jgi:hypothetical protein